MGLNTIELVWLVEEHFGISVQETRLGSLRTVGDLAALIHERLLAAKQNSFALCTPANAAGRRRGVGPHVVS